MHRKFTAPTVKAKPYVARYAFCDRGHYNGGTSALAPAATIRDR
jgi:hypothetical protein